MVLSLFVRSVTLELPVMSQWVPFDSTRLEVLLLAVKAAPVRVVASDAVMLTTLLAPVTFSHCPSGAAVTVLLVKLMNLFLPPPETRITGPSALAKVLFVKLSVDDCPPPAAVMASALALAPEVVTVTLAAVMLSPCCWSNIPSDPAPKVLMVRLSRNRLCIADSTEIAEEFAPWVVIKVPNVLGRTVNEAPPKMRKPG